jgi:hypothetical protein
MVRLGPVPAAATTSPPTRRPADPPTPQQRPPPSLVTVLRGWGRIGCIGFGGPPTHIGAAIIVLASGPVTH